MKVKILIIYLSFMVSCTGEKSPVHQPNVSISEEQVLNFGDVGLSATVYYSSAPLDSKFSSYLLFNPFFRRLDTLKVQNNELILAAGIELPFEGPFGVPEFNFFAVGNNGNIFLSGNQLYFTLNKEIQNVNLTEEISSNGSLISILGGDSKNKTFHFSSANNNSLFVIIRDFETRALTLISYNLLTSSFTTIPFSFAIEQMNDHRIAHEQGPMMVENSFFPFLSVYDSTLIISYPFFNEISTLSLKNRNQQDFIFESKFFKNKKNLPIKNAEPLDLRTFLETSSIWNSDVNFGSLLRLNEEFYFRVVEEQNSEKVYLEIFSNEFVKVGEYNLSAIEPNIGTFHLPLNGKILFGSSKKNTEDILNYFWVNLE
jgi:hypothetical protein